MNMNSQEIFQPIAGEKPQGQIEAEKTATELSDRFIGEGMKVIEELQKEIENANLASRFSRTKNVAPHIENVPNRRDEASFKKLQLKSDIEKVQSNLIDLAGRIKDIVLDVKASQTEDEK